MIREDVRVIHEGDELAGTVDVADSTISKLRGVMFRPSLPEKYALVFPFDVAKKRSVHMLFVLVPIDVVWVVSNRVEQVDRLRPWIGFGTAEADMIIELPAGAAASVEVSDEIQVLDN